MTRTKPRITERHLVSDISWARRTVACECGYSASAESVRELDAGWRAHRLLPGVERDEPYVPTPFTGVAGRRGFQRNRVRPGW